jgi:N-acetyl-anhydromuramyl-L-alanine amidase AmpD
MNQSNVRRLIKVHAEEGYSREEIYNIMTEHSTSSSSEQMVEYFQTIDELLPVPVHYLINQNFKIAKLIAEEMEKKRSGISEFKTEYSNVKILNSRYALGHKTELSMHYFFLLDVYYGLERSVFYFFS